MQWFRRLTGWSPKQARNQQVAESVAQSCLDAVRSRVQSGLAGMSAAEVRGYVRARAALVIHQQLNALATEGSRDWNRVQVTTLATDAVVQQIVLQTLAARSATRFRRAA